jgi:hypothetical protein
MELADMRAASRLCLLLSASLLPLLGSTAPLRGDASTAVQLTDDAIEYRGVIDEASNQRAFELFMRAERKPRTLTIDSDGGSADAAMQLGAWIYKHNLDVSVPRHCLSSCASYVFPAGRIKRLGTHATLLWHGGATQALKPGELDALLDETLTSMSDRDRGELLRHYSRAQLLAQLEDSHALLVARERQFFEMLNVDPRIATLGQLYERQLLKPGEHYAGWDYSIEDLARLGVHDVVVIDERAWDPQRVIGAGRVYRLQLDRLPGFESRSDVER